jgi:methyl-accepting chemotaxis protein
MSNYIIELVIGCVVSLIAYFLKRTMDQLDKTTAKAHQNANDIKILTNTFELKHDSLGKQMEKLTNSLDKLTDKIETLHDAVNEIKYK